MKLIVGLGNSGSKYQNSRHNVGFLVVDELEKLNLKDVILFKPQKYMNRSGVEVKRWLKNRKVPYLPYLYVIHDDLDIPLGKFKICQKGPKVHNGLKSIYEQLGIKDFWHVRIGIDNRQITNFRGTGEEYVLQSWRPEERKIVNSVVNSIVDSIVNSIG